MMWKQLILVLASLIYHYGAIASEEAITTNQTFASTLISENSTSTITTDSTTLPSSSPTIPLPTESSSPITTTSSTTTTTTPSPTTTTTPSPTASSTTTTTTPSPTTSSTTTPTTSSTTTTTTPSPTTSSTTTPSATTTTPTTSSTTTPSATTTTPSPFSAGTTTNDSEGTSSTLGPPTTAPIDSTTNKPPDDRNLLAIILSVVLVTLFVIVAGILIYLYLRRSKRKNPGSSDRKVTSKVIDITEFENVLRDMNANSQLKFSEEFMALSSVGKEYTKEVAGLETNREKNRYTDIKPYDVSRVKLSINPEDESDYINASWIPGYFSRRQYIAAQGPMPSTQDDFWRMVWEYNSRIIIMLTKTVENNRIKCCQYWPLEKEVIMYGDISVNVIDETETDSWIVREMNVSMGQQKRLVKHCFYTKWPDMKAPEESSSIIDFVRMIRSYSPIRGSSPLVVHCSAGVGRTGAYIALDTAMYQIEEEEKVDIYGIVYKMRLNRVSMVQNERQYVFIYETVADIIRSYLKEKKNPSIFGNGLGQAEYFFGDLPKSDSIGDHVVYQNLNASSSALTISDDNKTLL